MRLTLFGRRVRWCVRGFYQFKRLNQCPAQPSQASKQPTAGIISSSTERRLKSLFWKAALELWTDLDLSCIFVPWSCGHHLLIFPAIYLNLFLFIHLFIYFIFIFFWGGQFWWRESVSLGRHSSSASCGSNCSVNSLPRAPWPSGILSRLDSGGMRLLKKSVLKYSWSLNMKKAWAVPCPASAILQKTAWASIHHVSWLEPPEETLQIVAVIYVFDAHCDALMILSNSLTWEASQLEILEGFCFFFPTVWKKNGKCFG